MLGLFQRNTTDICECTRLKPLARMEVLASLPWTNQHHAYLALKPADLNQKEADSHQHK